MFPGDAGFQSGDAAEEVGAAVGAATIGLQRLRDNDVGVPVGQRERRGQDPSDKVRRAVKHDGAADYAGITAEAALPIAMTEHGERRGAGVVVLRRRQPAGRWLKAEQGEKISGDAPTCDALRFAETGEVEVERSDRSEPGGGSSLPAEILEVGDGKERSVAVGPGGPDPDKFRFLSDGQGPEEHAIGDRKDSRGRSHAQGDGQRREQQEARRLAQGPESVAQFGHGSNEGWATGSEEDRGEAGDGFGLQLNAFR